MYLDWHRGMKVVCISDVAPYCGEAPVPVKNKIYTILDFVLVPRNQHVVAADGRKGSPRVDAVLISLEEFGNLSAYHAIWFRPLETRRTDISIFEKLLVPSGKVGENA